MKELQRTLANDITLLGKGLHTGVNTKVTIKPAKANSGIRFIRTDIEGTPEIPALAEFVVDTSRSTVIGRGDVRISTIEHCLAAMWGCGIDNATIEINGPEMPILDGSAMPWVEEFEKAGTVEQDSERVYFEIPRSLSYVEKERGVEIVAFPEDGINIITNINFNSNIICTQYASIDCYDKFNKELAPCRTFVFFHELKPLMEANLIKGGDLDNAIVIIENELTDKEKEDAAKLFNQSTDEINHPGYVARGGLRFPNEIARHKLLDIYGDLALVGCRLKGRIVATRPGHKANTEFAKLLRKEIKAADSLPPIQYHANMVPVLDINDIKKRLPHRSPFLLVDKIMELGEEHVIGIKQVTMNEPFFTGHFPDEPVMPGVLQIEAVAQCGGILALSKVDDPENYSTYFMKIDNVKFKRKVVPGDTLLFSLRLKEPIRRGIVSMFAKVFVGNELACEAELMAMVTKDKK